MAVDYEAWAVELCTLLDRIEVAAGGVEFAEQVNLYAYDEETCALLSDAAERAVHTFETLHKLCFSRHDIARKHGFTVEFTGQPGSAAEH